MIPTGPVVQVLVHGKFTLLQPVHISSKKKREKKKIKTIYLGSSIPLQLVIHDLDDEKGIEEVTKFKVNWESRKMVDKIKLCI